MPVELQRGSTNGVQMRQKPDFQACTVFILNASTAILSTTFLDSAVADYELIHDIWTKDFLDCILIQAPGEPKSIKTNQEYFASFLEKNKVKNAFVSPAFALDGMEISGSINIIPTVATCDLKNGPYIATISGCGCLSVGFTPAYGLFLDDYEAFMVGALEDASLARSYLSMQVSVPGTRQPAIIIPSRLPALGSDAGPLAGLRFAAKDICK
jgi:hypothetical protein